MKQLIVILSAPSLSAMLGTFRCLAAAALRLRRKTGWFFTAYREIDLGMEKHCHCCPSYAPELFNVGGLTFNPTALRNILSILNIHNTHSGDGWGRGKRVEREKCVYLEKCVKAFFCLDYVISLLYIYFIDYAITIVPFSLLYPSPPCTPHPTLIPPA